MKDLEALERLNKYLTADYDKEAFNIIKQRLESIDNANPSEALECLKRISIKCHPKSDGHTLIDDDLTTIKQELITKSKKELAWEIVVKYGFMHIHFAMQCKNYDIYLGNMKYSNIKEYLTKEEFNLLKEML